VSMDKATVNRIDLSPPLAHPREAQIKDLPRGTLFRWGSSIGIVAAGPDHEGYFGVMLKSGTFLIGSDPVMNLEPGTMVGVTVPGRDSQ
jgi:hypothetical protein